MATWRDELIEAVKSKAEREAEDQARIKKRVEEALATATQAIDLGKEGLRYTHERLKDKGQPAEITDSAEGTKLTLGTASLALDLSRETAVVKVTFGDGKPREFDFAKDRHIAPADVEEYVGRRALELVRTAYKTTPW